MFEASIFLHYNTVVINLKSYYVLKQQRAVIVYKLQIQYTEVIFSQDVELLNWCHSQYTQRSPRTAAPCARDTKYSLSF